MRSLILVPVFFISVILQSTIISQFSILSGTADLILLIVIAWSMNTKDGGGIVWAIFAGVLVSLISSLSPIVPIAGYVLSAIATRAIASRTWQVPLIASFFSTIIATVILHSASIMVLWVNSDFVVDILQMVQIISIPSLFINLILIIPVNSVVRDIAHWVYPETENI